MGILVGIVITVIVVFACFDLAACVGSSMWNQPDDWWEE